MVHSRDLIVHRPDLPLWPGGPKFGLDSGTIQSDAWRFEFTMYIFAIFISSRRDAGARQSRNDRLLGVRHRPGVHLFCECDQPAAA